MRNRIRGAGAPPDTAAVFDRPLPCLADEFLTTLEFMPTLAAVAGAKVPDSVKLDGFNMLPVLRGEVPSSRSEMFWERRGERAARLGQWKWIESARGGGLFDLKTDRAEKNDLSQTKPEIAAKLTARWQAWRADMDAAEPRGPFLDY